MSRVTLGHTWPHLATLFPVGMSFTISGAMLSMSAGIYMISSFGDCSHHRNEEYVVNTDSITDDFLLCNILLCCKGGRTKYDVHQLLMGGEGGGKYSWEEQIFVL